MKKQPTPLLDHGSKLERLHEQVNAMLDMPAAKDGDEFPLSLEATLPASAPRNQAIAKRPQQAYGSCKVAR